jgi:short-subunit dehydrogenase
VKRFDGRVAAITGAASGIGRALAVDLAGRGAHLALSDVDEAGMRVTAATCEGRGVKVTTHVVDVADRGAVFDWADVAVADHGAVHLVVNNAGVALVAPVETMAYDDLEWLMGVNFWGVVHGTKAFLPHLTAAGEGHIVNVSSVFGLISIPSQSAYNAAKFAVRGFTEALREELDLEPCGVSCTSVHPGGIRTNIARSGRVGGLGALARSREEQSAEFERLARTTPETAAETIVAGIRHDRRRVLIGTDAHLIDGMQRLLPTGYQRLIAALVRRQRLRSDGRPA